MPNRLAGGPKQLRLLWIFSFSASQFVAVDRKVRVQYNMDISVIVELHAVSFFLRLTSGTLRLRVYSNFNQLA